MAFRVNMSIEVLYPVVFSLMACISSFLICQVNINFHFHITTLQMLPLSVHQILEHFET